MKAHDWSRIVATWNVVWDRSGACDGDLHGEQVSDEGAKRVSNCVVVFLFEAGFKVAQGFVAGSEHSEGHICHEVAQSVEALQIGAKTDEVVVKRTVVVHVEGASHDLKILGHLAHPEANVRGFTCSL